RVAAEEELRGAVLAVVRTWDETLRDALVERLGEDAGERLADRWASVFSDAYRAEVTVARAVDDIVALDAVAGDGRLRIALRDADRVPGTTELRAYVAGEPLVLSEFMPVLENLGLRALAEDQVIVSARDGRRFALQSFFVQDRGGRALDTSVVGGRLVRAPTRAPPGRPA